MVLSGHSLCKPNANAFSPNWVFHGSYACMRCCQSLAFDMLRPENKANVDSDRRKLTKSAALLELQQKLVLGAAPQKCCQKGYNYRRYVEAARSSQHQKLGPQETSCVLRVMYALCPAHGAPASPGILPLRRRGAPRKPQPPRTLGTGMFSGCGCWFMPVCSYHTQRVHVPNV